MKWVTELLVELNAVSEFKSPVCSTCGFNIKNIVKVYRFVTMLAIKLVSRAIHIPRVKFT